MKVFLVLVVLESILIVFLIISIRHNPNKETERELIEEKSKNESLHKFNHELKNPIAVVNGYIELYSKTNEIEQKEKYFNIIQKEISRCLTIIDDFSELGKMKDVEKEIMDLDLLFEEIIEVLSPLYKKNNAIIVYKETDEILINGCFDRLKQVFINILKNSLEAKDKDFLVVEIKLKKQNKEIKVQISDNGIGMSKNELKKIENSFYTTKANGNGIGLSYVRQILELHEGDIEFKSKEKKGTTAIVTLPINISSNSYL